MWTRPGGGCDSISAHSMGITYYQCVEVTLSLVPKMYILTFSVLTFTLCRSCSCRRYLFFQSLTLTWFRPEIFYLLEWKWKTDDSTDVNEIKEAKRILGVRWIVGRKRTSSVIVGFVGEPTTNLRIDKLLSDRCTDS